MSMDDERWRQIIEEYLRRQQINGGLSSGTYANPYQYPMDVTTGAIPSMPGAKIYQPTSPYPDTYSLVEVQFKDSTEVFGMVVKVSPNIGKNFTENMRDSGFLYLFGDSESVILRAENIVAVKITKITTGE